MAEVKRIFIGGLVENITDKEICERFNRFGDVTDVNIHSKNDLLSGEKKIFAYINLKTTDEKLDKCIKVYNKSKWKGRQLQVEKAKENFLQRLQKERLMHPEDEAREKRKLHSDDHNKIKETVIKSTPQGTPVENMRNWVVAKQGKILPVMYIRRKDKKKVIKVDPSKYIHCSKTLDDDTENTVVDPADIPVDSLTWWQEEKPKNSAIKNMNSCKTKTVSDSQLKSEHQDVDKGHVANSNIKKSGYFEKSAATSYKQQNSRTVNFYSDSDCDQIEQVLAPVYCSSSEDTDEMLSKLKMNNRHIKSQSEIKLERKVAERRKSATECMGDGASYSISEVSDDTVEGQVGSLPKWLESESESDLDCQTTAVSRQARLLARKNKISNEKQLPISMTSSQSLNQSSNKKTRINSVKEQKPVSENASVDNQPGNNPRIQTKDITKQGNKVRREFMPKTSKHIDSIPNIIDEYSSGFQEQQGNQTSNDDNVNVEDDDEFDIFDIIESGKLNKLYKCDITCSKKKHIGVEQILGNQLIKANDLKTTKQFQKDVLDPQIKIRTKITDIGSTEIQLPNEHASEEVKRSKRKILDFTTELKSDDHKGNKKVLCSAELAAKVNEKRLSSLKERLMEAQQQKAIVTQALAVVDSQQHTNKKIVFDSDEELEMKIQEDQVTSSDDGDNQPESDFKQKKTMKKKIPMLFGSDSSELSEDDDITNDESDNERFKIRPEFEGHAGKKLLQLQSRYGNDRRFKLDSRFIESNSSSNSDSDDKNTIQNKDGAASEKDRALEILCSLVGHEAAEGRKKEKTFRDINTLHYDPASTTHSEFEIQIKKTKKKISNKKKPEVEKEENKDKPDLPEVSKERFYEVKPSLKDLFGSKDNEDRPFSLTAAFGHVNEDEDFDGTRDDGTQESLTVHRNIVSWQNPVTDKDSSDEHNDDKEAFQNNSDFRSSLDEHLPDVNTRKRKRFFLQLTDDDVQESLKFFTSPEDKNELRAKWLEARPGLVEAYKMKRRQSLRQTHAYQKFKVNKHGRRR